jgi:hypothetical protein
MLCRLRENPFSLVSLPVVNNLLAREPRLEQITFNVAVGALGF